MGFPLLGIRSYSHWLGTRWWEYPWLGTSSSTNNWRSLKILYTHPQSLGITLETFHFPENVSVFSNPTRINQSSINLQQNKPTAIGLIIHKHSTPTKLCHLACEKTVAKLLNPLGNTTKFWTHLPLSFLCLTPKTKR